jgi:polyhydroxyalkanoate synthase
VIPVPAVRPAEPELSIPAPATAAEDLDHAFRAGIAKLTGGLAPTALASAFLDWAVHLVASPGKQLELADNGPAQPACAICCYSIS